MDFPDPIPALSKEAGATPIENLDTDIPPPRATFLQSLALFNGRKTSDSLWKLVLRLIGWSVMIGVVIAYIFMMAPVRFHEEQIGYMYAGAFLGAMLGFLLAGLLADWSTRVMTRWNKGVFEPEFRILLVLPQAITGITGVFLFGWTASKPETYGWAVPDFFFGME
jgi:MFS family permease